MDSELRIRPARAEDAGAFAAIYEPYVTRSYVSFEESAPDEEEMRQRMSRLAERYPWLAAFAGDRIAGYAYASMHRERAGYRWSVDVSVYVDEAFHRQGIGRRLYTELFDILERQRFRRAYAGITLPNDASVGLHRAMGFEEVGVYRRVGWKKGKWYDVLWLARNIGADADDPEGPVEPAPFASLTFPRTPGEAR